MAHAGAGAMRHPREVLDDKFIRVLPEDPALKLLEAGTFSEENLSRCAAHAEKLYRVPDLANVTIEFATQTNAKVVFAPTEDEIAAGDGFQFGIRYTDKVYPICHEGVNRSQVAYLVAQGILRKMGTHFHNVERPHGAETGFDPHAGYTSVTEDNYYEFTHGAMLGPEAPSEWQHRCFVQAFGGPKVARFGHEEGSRLPLNPNEHHMTSGDYTPVLRARQHMRKVFEDTYYSNNAKFMATGLGPNPANPPLPTDTRRVFVCFMRSGPIVMQRMLDAHVRTGVDLSNVVIVCIPWKDTISSACSQANIDRARAAGDAHASRETVTVRAFEDLFARIAAILVGTRSDPAITSGKFVWLPRAAPNDGKDGNPGGAVTAPASDPGVHEAAVVATPHSKSKALGAPVPTAGLVVAADTGAGAGAGAGAGGAGSGEKGSGHQAASSDGDDGAGGGTHGDGNPGVNSARGGALAVAAAGPVVEHTTVVPADVPPTAPPPVTIVRRGQYAPPSDLDESNPARFKTSS